MSLSFFGLFSLETDCFTFYFSLTNNRKTLLTSAFEAKMLSIMGNFSATLTRFPISLEEADIVKRFDEHPFINMLRVIASQVCHQRTLLFFIFY